MKCNKCKKKLRDEIANYVGRIDNKTIIIENTPINICDNCYKEYYTEDVVKNIEEIMEEITKLPIEVSVIKYNNLIEYIKNKK